MKNLKRLSFAAMTAVALAALVGSAAANPVVTSPANVEYTGTVTATAEGSVLVQAVVANFTCTTSTLGGKVETNNTTKASGKLTTVDFSGCDGTFHPAATGSFEIVPTGATGSGQGIFKGSGTELTVATLGVSCVYGTAAGTTLGTLTGGNPAILIINAQLPKISGGFLCANPASMSGSYSITTPKPMLID
jgi:hypothetical protein